MSNSKSIKRNSSSNQSINSITTKFPLPNATKPRYIISKKIEINQLSDDILLYIFRFLSPIDLFNISIVCRRWYSISQDESLWRSLVYSYHLNKISSTLTNKQRIQTYLNQQIKIKLKSIFSIKFDRLKSYTGIPDYKKIFNQFHFFLAFCDDKHNIIWSQKYDTIEFFDTSMSIRWLEITMPEYLSHIHFLRLYSIVSININTHSNRIQSLLHEYSFNWNLIKTKSISLINDIKSSIYITRLSNENDDVLVAIYKQDKSFAFLVFNINYLSFHENFFIGLRLTNLINNKSLSQIINQNYIPLINDLEVSVFICFRNMTTIFLRHRFFNCRVKYLNSFIIELINIIDITKELGPELEELPKFNWKTNLFKGTINDIFLIDVIVLNERKNVSFSVTLPAILIPGNSDEFNQEKDSIISSNVWNIKAISQCNNNIRFDGIIMRLDSEYCALGRDSQSWHLQNMTCSFLF